MLGLRSLFTLIALLAILLMQRDQAGPLFRLLSVLALLGCLFALALSLSMTSVLLAPVMVAVLVALCWHRIPPALAVAGLMIAIAGAALGPLALTLAGINPIEAVLGAVGKSPTLTGRVYLWQVALEVYRDNPLAGVGYRAFWQAPHFLNERLATEHAGATTSRSFHSFPLEILTSAGWPALFAMLALIWVSTTRMLRVYWHSRSVAMAGGLSLMVGIVVSSLLGTTLYRGHEIMIILVVAFAVSAGEDLRRLDVRQAGGTGGLSMTTSTRSAATRRLFGTAGVVLAARISGTLLTLAYTLLMVNVAPPEEVGPGLHRAFGRFLAVGPGLAQHRGRIDPPPAALPGDRPSA